MPLIRVEVNHYFHFPQVPDSPEVLARLGQLIDSVAGLTAQGDMLMGRIEDIQQNLTDMGGLVDQLRDVITTADSERQALRARVAELIAAADLAEAEKTALAAKIEDAFAQSEDVENKMRAAVPGVPPVGGTPLGSTYVDRASFDDAVANYTGAEAVNVDGSEVKAGTSPAIEFYSHSADGSVSTSGPTD